MVYNDTDTFAAFNLNPLNFKSNTWVSFGGVTCLQTGRHFLGWLIIRLVNNYYLKRTSICYKQTAPPGLL
jgi:hypothetical protein